MTIGELKKVLEPYSDDSEIIFARWDCGVTECIGKDIVHKIETCRSIKYPLTIHLIIE